MMKTPEKNLEPKSRDQLWRETVFGGALFLLGCVIIGGYVWHQLAPAHQDHEPETLILTIGCGASFIGLYMTNKKLVKEFMSDMREWIPFIKGQK